MALTLPSRARNAISLTGIALATTTAAVFVVLFVLHLWGAFANPYVGLLVFVAVPALFVLALLLIPLGVWWTGRRGGPASGGEWPVIDLRLSRHRQVALAILALTGANVVIVALAGRGAVHYMDSTEFCGQACHTTMEPQAVAHRRWPHADVGCTHCHVGSGAGAFVEAKLAGTRQLWHVLTDQVPRPIPPGELVQPSTQTCERCHSRAMRGDDELRVLREFAADEVNTETVTTLRLRLGSPDSPGIHRHIGMDIEYVAADPSRETILAVRSRQPDGSIREFATADAAAAASGGTRRMDCTDCHNRPAHTFALTAARALDGAIAANRIPRTLAFVKREALAAVTAAYPDRASAAAAISARLREFYEPRGADQAALRAAIAGTQDVWSSNVFPEMEVTWGTYPNHIGHIESPGCFRCHDESRRAADGATISQDCELCHTFD
jgi:hypothetical protein